MNHRRLLLFIFFCVGNNADTILTVDSVGGVAKNWMTCVWGRFFLQIVFRDGKTKANTPKLLMDRRRRSRMHKYEFTIGVEVEFVSC